MHYNSLNKYPSIQQPSYISQGAIYQKSPTQFQYTRPQVIRLPPKQFENAIGNLPINKTPIKQKKEEIRHAPSIQTVKSSDHKQYFEKPQLRMIKPISSLNKISSIKYGLYNSSQTTQSTKSQYSQLTLTPQPISLDWSSMRRKTDTNLFAKFNLGCNSQKSNNTSYCNCSKPCRWARRWSGWAKMPKQIIYNQLKSRSLKKEVNDQINKDLLRTQPGSIITQLSYFKMLREVLEVYSKYDEDIGYIQGMNMVVSVILYHVKDAEQTFWILVDIMQRRQFKQIYQNQFKKLKVHTQIINKLVKYKINDLYLHLIENGVQLEMVTTGWFLSLMCNLIPLEHAHLMIDMFITEGFAGFYKIILTYLLYLKEQIMIKDDASDILNRFSSTYPQDEVDWEQILDLGVHFKLTEHDIWNIK